MRVRLKFRDTFQAVELYTTEVRLIELLHHASNIFKIEERNVQVSLNAKDFFGLESADLQLKDFGIVSGDVIYVRSLESLDDIKLLRENELVAQVTDCFNQFMTPKYCVVCLICIPLHVFATQKGLKLSSKLPNTSSNECEVIRLVYTYELAENFPITFTLYKNENILCLAGSVQGTDIRVQLIIKTRDFLVDSHLLDEASFRNPKFVYKQLQLLSISVKDSLLEPILMDLHTNNDLPQRLMLLTLPSELLTRIFICLPLFSLGQLMLTCKEMLNCLRCNTTVWRIQLTRLEAKKKPVAAAALSRQQQHQLQRQAFNAHSTTHNPSPGPLTREPRKLGSNVGRDGVPTAAAASQDSLSELRIPKEITCPAYQKFLTRYRSILIQRWHRGLAHTFN